MRATSYSQLELNAKRHINVHRHLPTHTHTHTHSHIAHTHLPKQIKMGSDTEIETYRALAPTTIAFDVNEYKSDKIMSSKPEYIVVVCKAKMCNSGQKAFIYFFLLRGNSIKKHRTTSQKKIQEMNARANAPAKRA